MTRVYTERKGKETLVALEGHATGREDVCAAVSGLVCAYIGYLQNSGDAVKKCVTEPGHVRIVSEGDGIEAYNMLVIGLMQLAAAAPEHVKIDQAEIF